MDFLFEFGNANFFGELSKNSEILLRIMWLYFGSLMVFFDLFVV